MIPLLLVAVGLTVLFFLLVKLVLSYTTRLTGAMVDRNHRDIEEIMNTGRYPDRWLVERTFTERVLRGRTEEERLHRRLAKLRRYALHSPLIADERARKTILDMMDALGRHGGAPADAP